MQKMARATLLRSVFELAERDGIDRAHILREIEVDLDLLADPAALVPSSKLIDAVEYAAAVTGREDFGLSLGQLVGHRSLGPVGVFIEHCRTVAEAVADGSRYLHLHNAALRYTLTPSHDRYVFRAEVMARGSYEPRHYSEAMLAMSVCFFRKMLGAHWRPMLATMVHERMAPVATYQRVFGCPVEFAQKINAVVVQRGDFDRRVSPADPRIKELARSALDELDREQGNDITNRTKTIVRSLLPLGKANATEVSQSMSLSERVLQRRLAVEGTTFKDVLKSTRLQIIRELLARDGATMDKIAPIVGLSDATAVSRFLRDQAGQSVRELKAASRQTHRHSSTRTTEESSRLSALAECQILDSAEEPAFDRICLIAHHLVRAPIALVSFIDASRQWVKARVGCDIREIPRDRSLCARAIANGGKTLWIADTRAEKSCADSEVVKRAPRVRFYAGAPIILKTGEAVGTVCVMDPTARPCDALADDQLRMLADLVADLLEHRRTATARDAARTESLRNAQSIRDGMEAMSDGLIIFDADDRVLMWNARYLEYFPHLAGRVRVGQTLAELAEIAVRAAKAGDDAASPDWKARRLALHGNPRGVFIQRVAGRVIESVSRPLSDGGSVTMHRDITERYQLLQTLAQSRRPRAS